MSPRLEHPMPQMITYCFLGVLLLCTSPYVAIGNELGLFNEQPKNTTAPEGTNATFNCSIKNPSYKPFWRVNNTDVSYSEFKKRRIELKTINNTFVQLIVAASWNNNNTNVVCLAVPLYGPVLSYPSETAFLVVEVPDGAHWGTPTQADKREHSASSTVTPTTSTTPLNTISINAASTKPPAPLTNTSSSDDDWAVPVIAAGVFFIVLITFIIITICVCIVVWFKKKRQKKTVSSNGIPQEALRKESLMDLDSANTGHLHLGKEYSNGMANFNMYIS